MSVLSYNLVRFMALCFLLLVGVGSDPAIMNSDSSDDDTMVVAVETDLAAPYKTIADAGHRSQASKTSARSEQGMLFGKGRCKHAPAMVAAPLVVPLRT